jgi:hypothetical protein
VSFIFPPTPVISLPVHGTDARFALRRIFCVGRNYGDHIREMGFVPEREPPFFFTKPIDAIVEDAAEIAYPLLTQNFHHEAELVIAIGKDGRNIAVEQALEHVFGYATGNDLTRRDLQLQLRDRGRPWDWSKAFDQSAVCGTIYPVQGSALHVPEQASAQTNALSIIGHEHQVELWLVACDQAVEPEHIAVAVCQHDTVPRDLVGRNGVAVEDATVRAIIGARGLDEAVHGRQIRLAGLVLSTWREVGAASADIAIMSAQISRRGQYQSHRAT